MTLETALAWSIGRSILVTTVALPVSLTVWRLISGTEHFRTFHRLAVIAALMPLFVPDLLIGFTYRMTSARLIHSELVTELLYVALLLFRIQALQVAVRMILPSSSVSAEALFSWKLVKDGSARWWLSWLRLHVQGPLRTTLIAWVGGALFCFQEFETAALLQIDRHPVTWSVWLFDAHASGEPLARSLQFASESMVFQVVLLLPIILLLSRGGLKSSTGTSLIFASKNNPVARSCALFMLLTAVGTSVIWPVWTNGGDALSGLRALAGQGDLTQQTQLFLTGRSDLALRSQQIVYSALVATIASVTALQLAIGVRGFGRRWLTVLAVVPGLCGSLVVSLTLLAVFQAPGLNVVYDSWLPMVVAATLLMLPRALLLIVLLEVLSPPASIHSARLLRAAGGVAAVHGRNLIWQYVRLRWLVATAALAHWSFWDVSVASMLRPVRFEPIVVRLYNEMHYRGTETLVAITLLALAVPAGLTATVAIIWKQLPDRDS